LLEQALVFRATNITVQGNLLINSAPGDGMYVYGDTSQVRVLDNYIACTTGNGIEANLQGFSLIFSIYQETRSMAPLQVSSSLMRRSAGSSRSRITTSLV
jgi:hypothetical protein